MADRATDPAGVRLFQIMRLINIVALLAFLGNGHTMTRGVHKEVVRRGIKWLASEQDRESGLFGEEIGHAFLYDHAIATLAMCESYYLDRSTVLKSKVQRALNYISRARNPS